MVIIVALIFQSPQKREWLPQETEAILSVNLEQLEREDLPKRWQKGPGGRMAKCLGRSDRERANGPRF